MVVGKWKRKIIWAKFPSFHIKLWTKGVIREITSKMRKLYYVDEGCMRLLNKKTSWLLVEVVLSWGLPAPIDLYWETFSIQQEVDYWGIPFRCLECHKIGHLLWNCPNKYGERNGKSKEITLHNILLDRRGMGSCSGRKFIGKVEATLHNVKNEWRDLNTRKAMEYSSEYQYPENGKSLKENFGDTPLQTPTKRKGKEITRTTNKTSQFSLLSPIHNRNISYFSPILVDVDIKLLEISLG